MEEEDIKEALELLYKNKRELDFYGLEQLPMKDHAEPA